MKEQIEKLITRITDLEEAMDSLQLEKNKLMGEIESSKRDYSSLSDKFNYQSNFNLPNNGTNFNSESVKTMFKSGDSSMEFNTSLNPDTTATYSLGTSALKWLSAYITTLNSTTVATTNLTVTNINGSAMKQVTGVFVTSTGSAGGYNPENYTVARTAGAPTGRYTVTHNFGTTTYIVQLTAIETAVTFGVIASQANNTVDINMYDYNGNLTDCNVSVLFLKS